MDTAPLTPEEHEARAMLLGMRYHHGNGDPFYYKDMLDVTSYLDANTLEPLYRDGVPAYVTMKGRRIHKYMTEERIAERAKRIKARKGLK